MHNSRAMHFQPVAMHFGPTLLAADVAVYAGLDLLFGDCLAISHMLQGVCKSNYVMLLHHTWAAIQLILYT